ncbi:MAG: dihydrolipoyl dehydrogenase [Thermaerobacter sp.]|nr:dihydrolipoyl dehydrogenase [Thermaerobacter sp.]
MAEEKIDVLFLGGGTGGYEAAIRAAQSGLKAAVVEKEKVGGVCLHKGCIPSKALLRTAELAATLREAEAFGIQVGVPEVNFGKAQERKQKIVDQLYKGVQGLLKRAGVQVYEGVGTLMPPSIFAPAGAVSIDRTDGERDLLSPDHIVIATGSSARELPGLPFDGKAVISSDHALEMSKLPKDIIIVGAGAIGCEWASLYNDLGVKVHLVEALPRLLPLEDKDVSDQLQRLFTRRGIDCYPGHAVDAQSFKLKSGRASIDIEGKDGKKTLTAAAILVAIGRKPNSEGLGIENFDKVQLDRGYVKVDRQMRTGDPRIFAIGDVIGGLQLAHVAVHEGITAVEAILGENPPGIDYNRVPRCTYTRPEVASVGITEEQAKEQGHQVKVGKYFFKANGKALIYGEEDGFAKLVADASTGDLLGMHIIGPHATDLIAEGTLALEFDGSLFDLQEVVHAHPTLYEILNDAALAADGKMA